VCEALQWALRTYGVPDQILTDNDKVFTARFGQGPGPVLFDRICANNGIRHLLTAPYSPTKTGKVERFHKTMRSDFLVDHDWVHPSIAALQRALDEWVSEYNTTRPHQSLGDRPPAERFALAASQRTADLEMPEVIEEVPLSERPPGVNRWVDQRGSIGLGGLRYRVGATFAGESVEVVVRAGLVEILHAGVLVATHAERRREDKVSKPQRAPRSGRSRPPTSGMTVTRRVDQGGSVSFAGTGVGPERVDVHHPDLFPPRLAAGCRASRRAPWRTGQRTHRSHCVREADLLRFPRCRTPRAGPFCGGEGGM